MKNTNYTNIDKIKIALEYKQEIWDAARTLYTSLPISYLTAFGKVIKYVTEKDKQSIFEISDDCMDDLNDYETCNLAKTLIGQEGKIADELKDALKCNKIEYFTKKRIKTLKTIKKKSYLGNFNFYTQVYTKNNKTFEELRDEYKNNDKKTMLKYEFLNYIRFMDIEKKKQSKKYSVSRDLDKDVYYETVEGRLAKIKKWQFKKYIKKGIIGYNFKALEGIPEGIYVKPMKLINKTIPSAQENFKLLIASCFEGIKECHMVIDTDFKTAYDPYYNNHQDTDGDKASNYSCMSGEGKRAQEFYGKINGCKVVRWETKDGEQVGRCIMYEWNGKRHFIRIYGRFEYHRTMINMLEAQMNEGDLFGRNKAIEDIKLSTNMNYDTNTMYLDGNRYGLKDEGGNFYMVADKYDCDCKTTGGDSLESLLEDSATCEHCGRRSSTDDGIWINDYFYCDAECAEADGWRCCERCGEWEHEDDSIYVEGAGYYCCETCARNAGYDYDDYNNEWTDAGNLGETADGRYRTTQAGAADYYNVDEDQVEWNIDHWENLEEKTAEHKGVEND